MAKWIKGATKNKGALHRALHVPEGEKIPMRKRAALAKTLSGFSHKKTRTKMYGKE